MSHVVMKLYSFECDEPGCEDADASEDFLPRPGKDLLRSAKAMARREGWRFDGDKASCPKHRRPAR